MRPTPLGTVVRGFAAGAIGAFAQNQFFRATASLAPPTPGFDAPEPEQREEQATATVARRFVEQLMQRGPLPAKQKSRAAQLVHHLFGGGWGVAYGLVRESTPAVGSAAGAAVFGTAVMMASDDVILPAFRLSGWPTAYPAKNHAYALAAHVVYGLAVWGAYEAMRRPTVVATAAVVGALGFRRRRGGRFAARMGAVLARAA